MGERQRDDEPQPKRARWLSGDRWKRAPVDRMAASDLPEVSLDAVVSSALTTLRSLMSSWVTLTFVRQGPPAPIRGDAVQLRRVVLELVKNARSAIVREGSIVVRLVSRDEGDDALSGDDVGACVRLDVIDSGRGLQPAAFERVLEAVHSGRPSAPTSVGLTLVYGVVRRHGGSIDLQPIHRGTRVSVYLPVAEVRSRL